MWILTMIIPCLFIYYAYDKPKPRINTCISHPLFVQTIFSNKPSIYFTNYNWNICYHLGVAKFIQEYLDTQFIEFKGISFGSLVSTALHLDISISDVYQYITEYVYHKNICVFLWNYRKNYRMFIEQFYQFSEGYPESFISPKYVVLKGIANHLLEIQPINFTNLLKMSYDLPFPSIIPRKIEAYGYIRDCYWSNYPIMDELNVSLTDHNTFPTPPTLQVKSWFHPSSKDDLDKLYKIGYAKAFIFFHSDKRWIPYFKSPPQVKNIRQCLIISQDLDYWMDELNI